MQAFSADTSKLSKPRLISKNQPK